MNETVKPVAQAVPAAMKIASGETPPLKSEVTKPDTIPVAINADSKPLNATEPQSKPSEHSTIASAPEKKSTEPGKNLNPAGDEDEQSKADAEVKAEEAEEKKAEDTAKVEDVKIGEPAKNDVAVLDNGDLNQNLFDADGDDDPDQKEHPEEKNEGELPYRDVDEDDDYGNNGDGMARNNNNIPEVKIPQEPEPTLDDVPHKKVEIVDFEEDPDSNFFTYLCALMFLCVLLYILHQNRQKILALFLEGRRGNRRGSRDRSRSGSKAAYSKLDCNLEEAIMSKSKSLSGKSMIIY